MSAKKAKKTTNKTTRKAARTTRKTARKTAKKAASGAPVTMPKKVSVTEEMKALKELFPKKSDQELFVLRQLELMMDIRAFEDKVFELLARDVIKGASHVYAGQEAVAVGACSAIGDDDFITSTHRGHGHCVARGGKLHLMLAELCGKATGYCRGRGGSMHIADVHAGNLGATGIVGGNLPVATGAGLACQVWNKKQVTICFFGDGAANNGVFHESLNLAGAWKLPVVYICENNQYGMSVPHAKACAIENIADRAPGYAMPGKVVDGMQIWQVQPAVEEAVERARKGEGPTLIEAKTYRYRGHSRSDPRAYRTKEEEQHYHDRDPIKQYRQYLIEHKVLTEKEFDALQDKVDENIAYAERFSLEESPYPDPTELYEDVYAGWVEGPRRLEKV